ncbi:tRNA-intron lyase [Malassezia sp. CBS 17886]|nr:tRNA-intron lyase [Malassezia sp. CBS 17886]
MSANAGTAPPTQPNIRGAGKKATLAKRHLYAHPLPVGRFPPGRAPDGRRSWRDWLNDWTKYLSDGFSRAPAYRGWYDELTHSVWITDPEDATQLWTQGFFGKGGLSRSEPTWAARKMAEATARERGVLTAEQMTQRRREERKLLKIERARAAVKAGIQLPDGITALGGEVEDDDAAAPWTGDETVPTVETGVARVKGLKYFTHDIQRPQPPGAAGDAPASTPAPPDGVEHFQLTMQEAFFLAGMLGCLVVRGAAGAPLSTDSLFARCVQSTSPVRPDHPFLLSYVVYHHFRSLGWIVKTGTKFCVDYLLYKRGPVFSHAEFAVLVVPEYEDEADAAYAPFGAHHNAGERTWIWFSMMNRVNTQVQKTVVLAHVLIPSLRRVPTVSGPADFVAHIRGGAFRVKEITIRRWVPARMKP